MAQNQNARARPTTILDSLGEEIIRIITPVSICMFLVVILVSVLNTDADSSASSFTTIASAAYSESGSDSAWDKLKGALLNALIFVAVVTVVTFILVLLFYFRCTGFLKYYMGFSSFLVLGFMGGYLVVIGVLVAYWFTMLPEWTTWVLLVAMALYDLAAVLLPGGPLRLLVELAISRDEDIPALVYEARPVINHDSVPRGTVIQRRVWRERSGNGSDSIENLEARPELSPNSSSSLDLSARNDQNETNLVSAEEGRSTREEDYELSAPLIQHSSITASLNSPEGPRDNFALEGVGLGSSGAIKLGLGDFIFYSVLVGRAAMYDFMTVYACYLAIVAGLGVTLMLLALYQKALPALPVSIMLGHCMLPELPHFLSDPAVTKTCPDFGVLYLLNHVMEIIHHVDML
nr:presenilin-like protein At2g29900 [Ipomoea batatas]